MRAVIDTNVVVSGLIRPRGVPGGVLRALRDRRFVGIVSPEILEELAATLARSWLQSKYGVDERDIQDFFRLLALRCDLIEPTSEIRRCRDPRDDIFLEAGVDGGADRIVTGDDDLRAIGSIEGVRVVTPAAFLGSLD